MTVELEGSVELPGADPTGFATQESFVHKRLIRAAIGFATAGPAGAIAGALSGGGGGGAPRRPPSAPPGRPQAVVRASGFSGALARRLPGGRTGLEVEPMQFGPTGTAVAVGTRIACPSGFHANKSDYWLNSGQFVQKGTRCVKNRRRNPMNPRALSRAIGRVDAGKALQGKLAEITTAKWTSTGKRK